MSKIRVLIVDDSVVVRKIISEVLAEDSDIEIIGTAANGKLALQKIEQSPPDIITLDVEMPELDGLGTLKEVRKKHPRLPIIMFSTLTERGAATTVEALSLGASDYVTKPANVGSVSAAKESVRSQLINKIKALSGRISILKPTAGAEVGKTNKSLNAGSIKIAERKSLLTRIDILAIGSSTGGPNALAEVIPKLPGSLPVPVVITQHMPPLFTKMLAERLNSKQDGLKVFEAVENMKVVPGNAYLAPGDYHMALQRHGTDVVIKLNQNAPEHSCRPAVDVMLRSLVPIYGANILSVILTGMGQDGLKGCQDIHKAGGVVLAQDEATSVVWGMPGFVAQAGIAEAVLPLANIAPELVNRILGSSPRSFSVTSARA